LGMKREQFSGPSQDTTAENDDNAQLLVKVLRRIRKPATRRQVPILVIMTGLPGTGKSFVGTVLANALDAAIVRTDFVRKVLFPSPRYTAQESKTVYEVAHRVTSELLAQGISVVFDGTNLREEYRRILYDIGRQRGAKVAIVLTTAPEDLVMQRLVAQSQGRAKRHYSDANWEVYQAFKASQEPVQLPHWTVDTSKDIADTLRDIIASLDSASLR
jgi:predicted kinase